MSLRCLMPVAAAWLMAGGTASAESPHRFSGEITAGVQYDSNVTIDEIDRVSRVGDAAAVIEVEAGWKSPLNRTTDVSFNYDLTQTLHQDFTAFNLQTHMASAQLDHDFGGISAGLNGRYIRNLLNGNGFSTTTQAAATASRSFGTTYQLRGAYVRSQRTYDGRPLRDAVSQALSLDGFYYLSGAANYLAAGVKHTREDAAGAQFSSVLTAMRCGCGPGGNFAGCRTSSPGNWRGSMKTGAMSG